MLRLLFLLFLASPACSIIPTVNLGLTLPDLQNLNLAAEACSSRIQNFAEDNTCFSTSSVSINVTQVITLAARIVSGLNNPLTVASSVSGTISSLGNAAVINFFETLCNQQSCVSELTNVLETCLPFDGVREVLVLLINFVTDFICARTNSDQLCLTQFLSVDVVSDFSCAFTGICPSFCKTTISNAANNYGCCFDSLLNSFEETKGVNLSSLRFAVDNVWVACKVDDPGTCTSAVYNPLTASPTSSSRAVSTAGVLTFVLMLYAMYWQM